MDLINFFSDYSVFTIVLLAVFAFLAGFIDAVVGGGGLIQLPALLVSITNVSLPTIFGTNKIAALSGTSIAAFRYAKRIRINYKLLAPIILAAVFASYLGAKLVTYIDVNTLKPIVLIILVVIAVYTFLKKDLGSQPSKSLTFSKQIKYGVLIACIVGFYDGFFGPGTGSFFVLGFVTILGFEFVTASAYSKIINCTTNIGALIVFIKNGDYIVALAILMSICNILGNFFGTKMAFKKGNGFIRVIFLVVVTLMIFKYGYDIFL